MSWKISNNIVCYPLNVKHRSVVCIVCLSIHMNYRISGGCNVIRLVYFGCRLWLFSCQAVTSFCCSLRLSLYLHFITCAPCTQLPFSVIRSVWMRVIKGIHAEENEQSFHQWVKGCKCDQINTKTTGNLKYLYLQLLLLSLRTISFRLVFIFACVSKMKNKNSYAIWIEISMEHAEHFIWETQSNDEVRNLKMQWKWKHIDSIELFKSTHDGQWTMQHFYTKLRIK